MDKVQTSRSIIDHMSSGQFAEIEKHFSPDLAQALPASTLAAQWTQIQEQVGPFKGVIETRTGDLEGMFVVMQMLEFEKAKLIFRLVYKDDHVAGMHFSPAP
jgi:hypothetical protein